MGETLVQTHDRIEPHRRWHSFTCERENFAVVPQWTALSWAAKNFVLCCRLEWTRKKFQVHFSTFKWKVFGSSLWVGSPLLCIWHPMNLMQMRSLRVCGSFKTKFMCVDSHKKLEGCENLIKLLVAFVLSLSLIGNNWNSSPFFSPRSWSFTVSSCHRAAFKFVHATHHPMSVKIRVQRPPHFSSSWGHVNSATLCNRQRPPTTMAAAAARRRTTRPFRPIRSPCKSHQPTHDNINIIHSSSNSHSSPITSSNNSSKMHANSNNSNRNKVSCQRSSVNDCKRSSRTKSKRSPTCSSFCSKSHRSRAMAKRRDTTATTQSAVKSSTTVTRTPSTRGFVPKARHSIRCTWSACPHPRRIFASNQRSITLSTIICTSRSTWKSTRQNRMFHSGTDTKQQHELVFSWARVLVFLNLSNRVRDWKVQPELVRLWWGDENNFLHTIPSHLRRLEGEQRAELNSHRKLFTISFSARKYVGRKVFNLLFSSHVVSERACKKRRRERQKSREWAEEHVKKFITFSSHFFVRVFFLGFVPSTSTAKRYFRCCFFFATVNTLDPPVTTS